MHIHVLVDFVPGKPDRNSGVRPPSKSPPRLSGQRGSSGMVIESPAELVRSLSSHPIPENPS